jgi:hypothetical protein
MCVRQLIEEATRLPGELATHLQNRNPMAGGYGWASSGGLAWVKSAVGLKSVSRCQWNGGYSAATVVPEAAAVRALSPTPVDLARRLNVCFRAHRTAAGRHHRALTGQSRKRKWPKNEPAAREGAPGEGQVNSGRLGFG